MKIKSQEIREIELTIHEDKRGKLIVIEKDPGLIPFDPVRVFFLYDVPGGQTRGGHAVDCSLFIIALEGEASLLEYRNNEKHILRIVPGLGFLIPPHCYFSLADFHKGTILSVFAPKQYKDTKYFTLEDVN